MPKSFEIPTWYWMANGLPVPHPEFRFHPSRQWRVDYAFVAQRVAVEIEGGIWANGRHTRGVGYSADMEKYNALSEAGWRLLRYPAKMGLVDFAQIKRIVEK